MTGSKAMFDMATRNPHSAEIRLTIDMDTIRESSRRREIAGTAHIAGTKNSSDPMAKLMQNVKLLDLMVWKKIVRYVQWASRTSNL